MQKKQTQKWIVALLDTEKQFRKLQSTLMDEDAHERITHHDTELSRLSTSAVDCINDLLNATTDLRENLERQQEVRKELKKATKQQQKTNEFSPPDTARADVLLQHILDIYGDLGIQWGQDPFTRIAKLKDAEQQQSNAR